MKSLSTLLFLFFLCFQLSAQYEPKVKERTFDVEIVDGVCSFHGIKIGDKLEDVNSKFGETPLTTKTTDKRGSFVTMYYPDYGLEFTFEGEYVRVILLYPQRGSVMGDIEKFKIYSRNTNTWRFKDMSINGAQPQDIITAMGAESINTKLGSGFTSAISNNVMGYKLINSGGSQDMIFYFLNTKENVIEHIANRLSE